MSKELELLFPDGNEVNLESLVFALCNRVEVIDSSGRAYTEYSAKNVSISLQDGQKTLKIFLENERS